MIDLDYTAHCPTTGQCASCGANQATVCTAATPVGVLCMELCDDCIDAGTTPRLGLPSAARAVSAHCEHLGIDLDEMAAITAAEGQA